LRITGISVRYGFLLVHFFSDTLTPKSCPKRREPDKHAGSQPLHPRTYLVSRTLRSPAMGIDPTASSKPKNSLSIPGPGCSIVLPRRRSHWYVCRNNKVSRSDIMPQAPSNSREEVMRLPRHSSWRAAPRSSNSWVGLHTLLQNTLHMFDVGVVRGLRLADSDLEHTRRLNHILAHLNNASGVFLI
jgi:hypothetical protein